MGWLDGDIKFYTFYHNINILRWTFGPLDLILGRILNIVVLCMVSEDFGGHGNSFHGTGGRGNKRAQMRYCLRVLRSVVSTGDEMALQDLADQGAINQIISKLSI